MSDQRPTPPPVDGEAMPAGIELRDLWVMVASLRRRVEKFEREDIVDAINEHDDRLDDHDSELKRLRFSSDQTNTWMSGIRHAVDETNELMKVLIARGK